MSSSTTCPARAVRPSGKLNKDNIADLELTSHRRFVETAQAPPPSKSHRHHHQQSIRLMRCGHLILNLVPVIMVNIDHVSPTLLRPVMIHQTVMLNLLLPPHHLNHFRRSLPKKRKKKKKKKTHGIFFTSITCFIWC